MVIFSNILFWDSRVGSLIIVLFIIINFFKKIYVPILCIVTAVVINIIIEFNTYYFKFDQVLKHNKNECEKNSFDTTHRSCIFIYEFDRVLYAIQRIDQRYWQARPAIRKINNYYLYNVLNRERPRELGKELIYIFGTLLSLIQNSAINFLLEQSKHLFSENIILNPQLSDYDRMVPSNG